jgi:hypothetical protein
MAATIAAFAVVAVMLISMTGFAIPFDDRNDYGYDVLGANESASIRMFTGDSFSYSPLTNLPTTIVASGSAMQSSGGFLTFASGTLSGSPAAKGTYTSVLTATWTSSVLQQQTTQTITFTVYDRISVTSSSSATALVGKSFSYDLTFTGQGDEAASVPTITNSNGLSWNSSTKQITGTPSASGDTIFTWTISSSSSGDSVQFLLTISSYDDLAITSPSYSEGYVGQPYSHTVTTSDSATITASNIPGSSGLTWNSPTLSGTPAESMGSAVSPYYKEYTITYTANATIGGIATQAQQIHTMRIYSALEFTTLPSINNVTVNVTGLVAKISMDITGATSVLIDWGDGSFQVIDPSVAGTSIDESHEYGNEGTYNVRIFATNDLGTVQSIVMLSASDDPKGGTKETEDLSGDIKELLVDHWYLIVILVLFLLFLIVMSPKDKLRNENRNKGGKR